jgi:hypothetical protein
MTANQDIYTQKSKKIFYKRDDFSKNKRIFFLSPFFYNKGVSRQDLSQLKYQVKPFFKKSEKSKLSLLKTNIKILSGKKINIQNRG